MEKQNRKFLTVQDITIIAIFTALISVCSLITIPIGPVPVTLQTFAVFATAGILGFKRGTISVVLYILLGTIGIPIFGGSGGPGVIAGPTGGYIIGFILTAVVVGLTMKFVKSSNVFIQLAITIIGMIVGDVLCFVIGTIQFTIVSHTTVAVALGYCVIPFIIPDLIKIAVAAVIVNRVKKYANI